MLVPAGPAARTIANLWWLLLGVATVVYVAFSAAMLFAVFHRRPAEPASSPAGSPMESDPARERLGVRWVVLAGAALPAAVLVAVFVVTLAAMRSSLRPPGPARVVVEVSGRLWWWEVRYPGVAAEPDAITANEIHIPVGEPVEVRLHSDNVIHSFWVPPLNGKLDVVPGKTNVTWLQADLPGVYRGQCAEYCGLQHARMGLLVIAEPRADFDAWLALQRLPALPAVADPALAPGRLAFSAECGSCHTVRGTEAEGTDGPDLTHFASRRTIAAATLPNTVGHLGGWITRAQDAKPGSKMPNIDMSAAEHAAILGYLRRLQ